MTETKLRKLFANTVCATRLTDTICLAALFLIGGYDAKDLNRVVYAHFLVTLCYINVYQYASRMPTLLKVRLPNVR